MNQTQLLEKFHSLPSDKQIVVFDFIEFLAARGSKLNDLQTENDDWTDADFSQMSMSQVMRGMEDETPLYSLDDLKERWQ
jgi:hypothetical protein